MFKLKKMFNNNIKNLFNPLYNLIKANVKFILQIIEKK
jgi:hypothetical protein